MKKVLSIRNKTSERYLSQEPANFCMIDDAVAGMARPGIPVLGQDQDAIEYAINLCDKGALGRQLNYLYTNGFRTIISLDPNYRDGISKVWLKNKNTAFNPIDLVNLTVPDDCQLFFDFFNVIEKTKGLDAKVAVHCGGGIGRTGTFLVSYILFKNYLDQKLSTYKNTYLNVYDLQAQDEIRIKIPKPVYEAIQFVRGNYNQHAVEFSNQARSLTLLFERLTSN